MATPSPPPLQGPEAEVLAAAIREQQLGGSVQHNHGLVIAPQANTTFNIPAPALVLATLAPTSIAHAVKPVTVPMVWTPKRCQTFMDGLTSEWFASVTRNPDAGNECAKLEALYKHLNATDPSFTVDSSHPTICQSKSKYPYGLYLQTFVRCAPLRAHSVHA